MFGGVTKLALCLFAAFALAACEGGGLLGAKSPTGPEVSVVQTCEEQKNANVNVDASLDCDKSTRTAEPFIVEPTVIAVPSE